MKILMVLLMLVFVGMVVIICLCCWGCKKNREQEKVYVADVKPKVLQKISFKDWLLKS